MRKSSISQDLVKLVPRLKTWNWEKQRWGRVYLVVHMPIASDTFPPWTPDVTEGCSGVDFYSTEWNCAARRKHMQVQGERGERTQERKGETDGGRLLRRRVFGGGVREWEEREARKESVWRGGGGKRVKEREREAPELLLMLPLPLLQPFDNSPPIQSAEEGRRSEQGWRRSKRHLSKDAPVLSRRER